MLHILLGVLSLVCVANAHFRLTYPAPRGAFVADQELKFCGGYTEAVSNRSSFPLTGGFFTIHSGHGDWTAGVMLSTVQNPVSFDNFSINGRETFVRQFAKEGNAGDFCIPLNISGTGVDVQDGANVTIQIVFAGGDGNLYQCADLTVSKNYTIPSNVTCANVTTATTSSSGSPNATQTAGAVSGRHQVAGYAAIVMAFCGVLLGL